MTRLTHRHDSHRLCSPCHQVDCTQEQALCQTHNVRGYPTLLLFEDGMVVKKYSGSRQLDDLIAFVKRNFHPVGAEVEQQKPEEPKEVEHWVAGS